MGHITEQENVEVCQVRHEIDKQTANADQRGQEHQLLPLLCNPGLDKTQTYFHILIVISFTLNTAPTPTVARQLPPASTVQMKLISLLPTPTMCAR